MIEKYMLECRKIQNLLPKEMARFLLTNNLGMDEEVYVYLKQMILSQLHLDEHMQYIIDCYFQVDTMCGDLFYVSEDGTVTKVPHEQARKSCHNFLFDMMRDIAKLDFRKFDDVLNFAIEYSQINLEYSEEDKEFLQQHPVPSSLKSELESYTSRVIFNWRNFSKSLKEKEMATKDLEKHQLILKNIEDELKGTNQSVVGKIKNYLLDQENRQKLRKAQEQEQAQINGLLLKIDTLNQQFSKSVEEYLSPDEVRHDLNEKLNLCFHLSTSKLNRKRILELEQILTSDIDLKKDFELLTLRLRDAVDSIKRNSFFLIRCNELFSDIYFQTKLNANLFSEDNLQSPDLLTLIYNIRQQMVNSSALFNHNIEVDYRRKPIKGSKYIKGANLDYNQIAEQMKILNKQFAKAKKAKDNVVYIRKCADIFQKFLMIHPFADGNGRTSRMMLTVMLAQKGIFIPSVYSSYIERDKDSMFMVIGDEVAASGNFKLFQDYLLNRVSIYNPGLIDGDYSYITQAYKELLTKKYTTSLEDNLPNVVKK